MLLLHDTKLKYMQDLFTCKEITDRLPDPYKLHQPKLNTTEYGFCSFTYFGARIWNTLPPNINSQESVDVFRTEIKNGTFQNNNAVRSIRKFPK